VSIVSPSSGSVVPVGTCTPRRLQPEIATWKPSGVIGRLIDEALEHTRTAVEELRELAHGIHPALLTTRGLAAAIEALGDRPPLPVRVEIPEERYPASVESAAYFVTAEALTNVAKYALASTARVSAVHSRRALVLTVEDDGVGGAMISPGSGLSGLRDRMAALGGALIIDSPPGEGTRIRAEIPLPTEPGRQPADTADAARA
jgi:signal transduction histidine kinase